MFLPTLVVRSRKVVTPKGTRAAAVHIHGEKIVGVLDYDDVPEGCPLDDWRDATVMPGVVDTHVHMNEPGRTEWEGFETGTRAASAGGVTTMVDMPLNSIPPTTTLAALEAKRQAARGKCAVDVGFWGGVVPGNTGELAPLVEAGVFGFKCFLVPSGVEEFASVSEHDLRAAMPALTKLGATLVVHAEIPAPIEAALDRLRRAQGWRKNVPWLSFRQHRRYATFLETRPKEAENEAIALVINLCRAYRTRTHIVHLSSSDALTPLFHARAERLPLTVETCPHYLTLVAEEIPDGATAFKCAPPIRDRANRELLWGALAGGLIQLIVSDHSPAPPRMKARRSGDFLRAWGGIASVQLSLPATWTEARARGYSPNQIAQWMCSAPARFAGLARKGAIDVGYDADMIVWHPDAEFVVEADHLKTRHKVTPYLGRRLFGVVERTYLRGLTVYDRGKPMPAPAGRLLVRGAQ